MVCGDITGNWLLISRCRSALQPRHRPALQWMACVWDFARPAGRLRGTARMDLPRRAPGCPRSACSGWGGTARRQPVGLPRRADPGGKACAIVPVLPTLMITAWLLPGLPLLLARRFFPVPMVLISVPLAGGLVLLTSRALPGRWPGPGTKERFGTRGGTANWSALWGLAGTLLVAAGFRISALRVHFAQLIVGP